MEPYRRILGVIRPTAEVAGNLTQSQHVGILGTTGTISSNSYMLEINKFFPSVKVTQEACPMWVPLVENNEYNKPGADYFVQQHIENLLQKDPDIDTLFLACTHYPLLLDKIRKYIPDGIRVFDQGKIVADSLMEYLARHPEMKNRLSANASRIFATTDHVAAFESQASAFYGKAINAMRIDLV
jgi:glutamate racemase